MVASRDYAEALDVTSDIGERHIISMSPDTSYRTAVAVSEPSLAYRITKRVLDVVVAGGLLVVLSPLLAVVAIAIKATSPGPVVFRQQRVGKDLRIFTCLKFRSMVSDAEWILEQDPELKARHATNWKIANDPRVTRVGRVIRRTSIDELPQLVNVLRGDMSLIGPRPYLPKELNDDFGCHAAVITQVRPGMTGLWQVSGRAHTTPMQRIELDRTYAQEYGLAMDAHIVVQTFKVVATTHGAF